MNQLKQLLSQILSAKQQKVSAYKDLISIIKKNQQQIVQKDLNSLQNSILLNFLIKKFNKLGCNEFLDFMAEFIEYGYESNKKVKDLVYQIIPILMTKYIQSNDQKCQSLQKCLKVIYNNEYIHFNSNVISKELLMGKSGQIGNLYREHFSTSIRAISQSVNLSEIGKAEQITSINRVSVKSILLLTIFNNLHNITERAIISYLWMVYIYCGGTEQEQQTGVSLYLLEKKNLFSIFKYYMSFQEMSIILLTLYELSVQRKKNKFELLSAINMIHKKAANQSMFKLSQVAQSIIHLLEDQYGQAFS